jgi:acyl-CoA thioester hydrolase
VREAIEMELNSLPITHRATIPDAYLDVMGHMNVMWYTHLFSMGAWGLFQQVGLDRDYFEVNRAGSFALEQHFRYLKEVHVGQSITIRSRVLGRTAKRWHLIHFMTLDETGDLAATSECVHTHVDLRVRRSSPMPTAICAAIDRLLAEHQRLTWEAPRCGALSP